MTGSVSGTANRGRLEAAAAARGERHAVEKGLQLGGRRGEPFELVPFVAGPHLHLGAEHVHLRRRHQAGMVVLVAGERQAEALHRVADEADRPVVVDAAEGAGERRQVVAGEIGHQPRELVVGAALDQPPRGGVADVVEEPPAPGGAAAEHQRRIERVRAAVDPGAQRRAAFLGESRFEQRAVFEDDDVPAEGAEQLLEALPQAFAHHGIEALAVVVDDPPAIAQTLLPAFEHRLEDVALVELGVADERHHAAFVPREPPAMGAHIVLHQRGEQRLRDAEADRAGGEIDVVGVLGARRIALRALVAAERFHPLAGLAAEQILDGVEDRARMRLHRDAVLRPQHVEIERGHDGGERGGRRLVAADLQAVDALAHVVRVVDHPAREPQHLALELAENAKLVVEMSACGRHGCLRL